MSLAKKNFIINVVFVSAVSLTLMFVLSFTGNTIVRHDAEERLMSVVRNAANQVFKGFFDEQGEFEGVYLTYFDKNGDYYCGYKIEENERIPVDIGSDIKDKPVDGEQASPTDSSLPETPKDNKGGEASRTRDGKTVWTQNIGGNEYYVCELKVRGLQDEEYFIRGLIPVYSNTFNTVLIIFIVAVLVLGIIAITLSYVSLRNATKPIRQMTVELKRVEKSSDLSNRMSVSTTDEEIQNLVSAYNEMLDRVEAMIKNQERFTSDVSHELRSPLTVLLAESEFALNDLKTVEEKDKSLEAIYRQTKRLTAMVKQLLDFTRVVNTESVALVDTDISSLTQDIVGANTNDRNIKVSCNVEHGIIVKTDETLYIRLLTNLIDNAVKYGKDGGIVVVTLKRESKVTLSVRDDGIGMSEETLKHIYDRMYQADKSRMAGSGLGLGLSFVKEISRILGCTITVESKLGEGSVFTVVFGQND